MKGNDINDILMGMFDSFRHTSRYKDDEMMHIMLHRQDYERTLDDMWRVYTSGNMQQVFEYRKQVETIKAAGLVVMRNKKTGKHKIVHKRAGT